MLLPFLDVYAKQAIEVRSKDEFCLLEYNAM
jgi:hypothetical protein